MGVGKEEKGRGGREGRMWRKAPEEGEDRGEKEGRFKNGMEKRREGMGRRMGVDRVSS